jgi:hypothetical protein
VGVVHDADECHDETILRIYGGHIIRVPFSLEEVLRWFGMNIVRERGVTWWTVLISQIRRGFEV